MDLFEERSKQPLYMTYRAVGSSTGQYEFVGSSNGNVPYTDFGSGDIPMSAANFAAKTFDMLHIPFAVGAISVFHHVPAHANGGRPIRLDGCTLAKIFSAQITTWDAPEIVALNPSLTVPAGTAIKVVHRMLGSSSTAGFTQYLQMKCPASWSLGSGSTITWPASTAAAQGSGGVSRYIADNEYAIGYLDAGHGHSLGFQEIALLNRDGVSLTSAEADLAATAAALVSGPNAVTVASDGDWSGVNLYDMAGPTAWPITMLSYFYVQKNMATMNAGTAALLKAFLRFIYGSTSGGSPGTEGQDMLREFRFTPLPAALVTKNDNALATVTWPAGMQDWTFETASATQRGAGAGATIFSAKRRSYAEVERELLNSKVAKLEASVAQLAARPEVVELHGSGTTNPSKYFWETMDLFSERSKQILHLTYRAVGSSTGQFEFVGEANPAGAFTPYNHFGSGDIPMSATNFAKLSGRPMVHIPFAMSAIAIFHSVPATANGGQPIRLTPCLLARIFSRQIRTWNDPAIAALNAGLTVPPNTDIKVVHRVHGSSSTAGITQYLETACPSAWSLGSGSTITWPADTISQQGSGNVASYIASNEYAIGYLDAGHGHEEGFQEIALENRNGRTLTSRDADISAAGTAALSATPSVIPADPSADWSGVNLYNLAGDTTWPITMFSYFYVQKDLSAMDPKTAAMLKALVTYTMSDEGSARLASFKFVSLPQQVKTYNTQTLASMTWPVGMPTFTFEVAATTIRGGGAEPYVLSGKRRGYGEYKQQSLDNAITALQTQVAASAAAPTAVIQLHGSGTTNPSKLFWQAMDLLEERAKLPLRMTYRAVGSGTGQHEFVGETNPLGAFTPYNHFGCGDIPMSQTNFAKLTRQMVHIPFAMGAIAIFHSVPSAANGGAAIRLTGCVLAKIFSRQIKTWDHAEIRALNPSLTVPANTNIKVVHRVLGSSSTAGTTEYLSTTCPASWTLGSGSTITWPTDTFEAQGSGNMATFLETNEYAIGYLDAGHGHSLGFQEIALQNRDGQSLTSRQADIGAAGAVALQPPSVIPSDPSADWSGVNLYDLSGATTWPITVFSYFYVMRDLTQMDANTAGMLKAFISYILSTEGQAMAQTFSFTPVPQAVQDYNTLTLSNIAWPAGMPTFTFETAAVTQRGAGAGAHVFSAKRRSFGELERDAMQKKIDALETQVAALRAAAPALSSVVQLHGSGTTNPSKLFWQAMDLLEERARVPLRMTYRAVGSGTGQHEFVGEANPLGAFTPYNHFGCGDIPMSQTNFAKLTRQMVHIPFAMGAIAIFHSVPSTANGGAAIRLDGCLLAKIFSRQITTWDHADIRQANPNLNVPANTNIKVVHRVHGSSSTAGTTEYLNKVCPTHWSLGSGSTITWPTDTFEAQGSGNMASFLETNEYAIGYLDAGHGHSLNLQEIALRNRDGQSLTSSQADIGAAGTAALQPPSVIPSDRSADWSGVNLYDLSGPTTWPITVFSYFYVMRDLTQMDANTAGILKAFISFILSSEGQQMAQSFSFTPVPQVIQDYNAQTLSSTITWPAGMPAFSFETAAVTQRGAGAGAHVLSAKRRSYGEVERESMQRKVAALEARPAPAPAPPVAAAGGVAEVDNSTSIAAIVLSAVAVLASSVSVLFTMRATRTHCFQTMGERDTVGARTYGTPTGAV